MSWLDRLKAIDADAHELSGHCQNRQNPGSVSFVGSSEAHLLSPQRSTDDAARDAFEGRAAIMEYDGGLSRAEAERLASGIERQASWRGEGLDLGDLRPCLWCRNLARSGRCMAAWRSELRAAQDYSPPIPGLAQRCIGYNPPADDPDQRPGRERWPELVESQARKVIDERRERTSG